MALQSKYIRFTKATATGVQTVSGVGFTGKALLLWTTYQTAAGATTAAMMGLGLTDGLLQSVRFIHHPGAEATTTSAQSERTDRIVWKTNATSGGTPTVQVEGEFTGFTADGFTLNWATNDGNAAVIHAIVLGGDISAKFTQVKVDVNAGETLDVTGVGFRPTSFIVMGGAADEFGTGDYNLGAPFGSMHGFGFSNAVDNVCGWTLGRGTGGAADCYRGQLTDAAASVRLANLSGGTSLMDARITAAGADGYTITRDVGGAIEPVQHVLCLRGVKFALGSFTAPLTAIPKVLDLPFNPDVLVLQTIGTTASENTADMGLSLGAWHRSSDESGGTWIGGVDAANPSVYRRATYEDLVIETRNASSGAAVMQATVDASDDASVTFDFSAVSGSADALIYMAMAATEIRGAFVAGEKTTVTASRAAAFGLDGEVNTFSESGKLKVFGKFELTEEITFPDNVRQVFNPGADVASLNAGAVSSDPASPIDGDIWYDSGTNKLKGRINGATRELGSGVTTTGSPATGNLAKFSSATSITNADLTGDVTTSGGVAATIPNDTVTYAKMQNVSAGSKLLGRGDSGSGDPQEITLGTGLAMSGTTLSAPGAGSSQVYKVGITIDGGGAAITTGIKGFTTCPVAGTITRVEMLSTDSAATAGDIVIDIWKNTFTNYPPDVTDTITASAKPTFTNDAKYEDSTLTGWDTTISAGDILAFKVDSAATVTKITLTVFITP